MPGMAETLTNNVGPLPTWAWAGLGTAGIAGYLIYRKKQSMNQQAASNTNQSNLGTVPISNLTVGAEPMPVGGDTNIITVNNPPSTPPPTNPVSKGKPPAGNLPPGFERVTSPLLSKQLEKEGFDIFTIGKTQYYQPNEKLTGGKAGSSYTRISSPTQSKKLSAQGFKILTIGNTQFYNPSQSGVKKSG